MKQNQINRLALAGNVMQMAVIFIITISLLLLPGPVCAQQNPTLYSNVYFFKVNPGKGDLFMSLMKEVNSKIQEERCKSGHWAGWYLYRVVMPAGSASEYDYAAVSLTTKFKNLFDDPYPFDSALHKAFAGKDEKFFTDFYQKSTEARTIVKRQIYSAISFADSSKLQTGGPYKYLELAFMKSKPGKTNEYIKKEVDTFRLIHKERIQMKAMSQWGFYSLELPYNMNNAYDFVCANFYDDIDMLMDGKYPEALKKVFPKVKMDNLFNTVSKSRDMVMSELWKLELYQLPGNK
jgi:hypothetical protein